MNIINIAHICCSERLISRTHPTAASMNIINMYCTDLLFKEADIKDPPNNSVHEQYQHSKSFLFRGADIEVPPDYSIHEHYQSERFRKIKASSQQWCGTYNRTERLTLGPMVHTIDCCIEQHELGRGNKKISLLETLTSWPHSLKRSVRVQNRTWNQKIDIYHARNHHLPWFALIRGSRGPPKRGKKVFQSTTKPPKIVVEGGSSTTTEYANHGRWTLFF
jgi:hypothetical protein